MLLYSPTTHTLNEFKHKKEYIKKEKRKLPCPMRESENILWRESLCIMGAIFIYVSVKPSFEIVLLKYKLIIIIYLIMI